MKEEITDTGSIEEKLKPGGSDSGASNLLEGMKLLKEMQDHTVVKKPINSELWHACSGPLVTLPTVGSLVYYFPQGHSEQVAVSTNRAAATQISNFSDLSSQLLCQVLNVTLHADKETDEIYAQMSLQTVNSEKDVFPIPNFGLKPSKHPAEIFCKTLTASDTSTHGGFSVPRRAAEKLFPQLDYSMQPPTQELLVRDLHDNTWTFRHIYRGQPKRHLLTTGWSMFVGAKRLRAGDAVLFTRDEKLQLLLGVRRANGQHTAFPSSVLSADSMHIGILAAAAQAAANRSPFTIFYNPRACPSQFVIPFSKYRKAVHGTQLSIGTRFGMMFETEDSTKRRYMGTIIRMSDLDPLRWPNSKWRSLQVEWDEPGCSDRPNRVSPWEIETPESIFVFPSLTTNLKRPFHSAFIGAHTEWGTSGNRPFLELQYPSIPSQWSDQLMKMLTKPHGVSTSGNASHCFHEIKDVALQEPVSLMQAAIKQKPELLVHDAFPRQCHPQSVAGQRKITNSDVLLAGKLALASNRDNLASSGAISELPKLEPVLATYQSSQVQSEGQLNEEKLPVKPMNPHNLINDFAVTDQNNGMTPLQTSSCVTQSQLEARTLQTQNAGPSILESASASALLQYPSQGDFNTYPMACPPLSESVTNLGSSSMSRKSDQFSTPSETVCPLVPSVCQELWDYHSNYSQPASLPVLLPHQDTRNPQHSSRGLQDLSDVNCYQRDLCSCPTLDGNNSGSTGSTAIDPSVSNTVLDDFCTLKKVDLPNPSDYLVENLCSTQDVQSQITSASLADSHTFSVQGYADNSGGASSSNMDFDDNHVLQQSTFQQVTPRFRTYTKIQKAGSVGRSIDVSSFKNYSQLLSEIERMFGLEGLLNDTCSRWKLVYVDFENDVLLVGDDPWEEFVGSVRCIRILSPSEFKKMGEEGMQLLNSAGIHAASGPTLEVGCCKNGFS